MIKRLLLVLVLMATPVSGTVTQLIGTLIDVTGTPVSGTACLKLPVNAIDTSTNRALSPAQVCFPVTNGTFPSFASIVPNDVISPAKTYYQFVVRDRAGALVFMANYVVLTGAGTFNVGLAIPTLVTTSSISFVNPASTSVSNVFTVPQTFPQINSSNGPAAGTGFLRMGNSDIVSWRNQSNTGDVSVSLVVTPAGNIPPNTLTLGNQGWSASFFSDTTQVVATGGLIRMSSGNSINWRNSANVSDIVIQKTNGDSLDISGFRGVFMPQTTFASINNPAPANGLFYYCSDCTVANPCAGGGTGALAKRLGGVWVCN